MSARILHPGCGNEPLPEWLKNGTEVRLDIDENCNPDINASITDMGEIGEFDLIYTCHTLEHLYQYDVEKALSEFYRVLKPGGMAFIMVPDVEGVSCDTNVLYESLAGPICGLDLYYGLTRYVQANPYYAHHTAFVKETMAEQLKQAGFEVIEVKRLPAYNLMGVGKKPEEAKCPS